MSDFLPDIENCLEVLKRGGIILYPTDTVWGLGCDATNQNAVSILYRLKHRPDNKSMVILVADEREVLQYVTQLDLQVFDYLKTVQKPTTVVYQGAIGLAENLVGPDGSIAIRLVKEPFCKHLIKRLRKPLVSTSANVSGQSTPGSFKDITASIKEEVDYIVNYRQDDITNGEPSAVVKWNQDGTVTVIRS